MNQTPQPELTKQVTHEPNRPALRGYVHLVAAVLFPVLGVLLILRADTAISRVAAAIFFAGQWGIFVTSAAFHRINWRPPNWVRMRQADHSMIQIGIACSVTAFALVALKPGMRWEFLVPLWVLTTIAVSTRVLFTDAPGWVIAGTPAALAMTPIIMAPWLADTLGWGKLAALAAFGVLAIIGGAIYAFGWPKPSEKWFGHHELFHSLMLIAQVGFWWILYISI